MRDIVHSDCAYSHNDELRFEKLEYIYSFIERCQKSNYGEHKSMSRFIKNNIQYFIDFIEINEPIYDYLSSISYIEELQKFLEESFYK